MDVSSKFFYTEKCFGIFLPKIGTIFGAKIQILEEILNEIFFDDFQTFKKKKKFPKLLSEEIMDL